MEGDLPDQDAINDLEIDEYFATVGRRAVAGGGRSSGLTASTRLGGRRAGSSAADSWTVEQVQEWLRSMQLGKYAQRFFDHGIDGQALLALDDAALAHEVGISGRLHRKKLLMAEDRLHEAVEDRKKNARSSNRGRALKNNKATRVHLRSPARAVAEVQLQVHGELR